MIDNNLLQPLDFNKLPEAKKNIGEQFFKQSKYFDPENKYSVPYAWGTVGIMHNKKMVDDPVDSWQILWNEKSRRFFPRHTPISSREMFLSPALQKSNSLSPKRSKEKTWWFFHYGKIMCIIISN